MADTHAQGEFSAQELMSQNLKNAKQALMVMTDLDKIKTPLETTMYMAGNKSTYRNQAYREMIVEMDMKTKEGLNQFIKEHKEKEL